MVLEILDLLLLVAALVVLAFAWRGRGQGEGSSALQPLFWILIAGCFTINGIESLTWAKWLWFFAAGASVVIAILRAVQAKK